MNLLEPWVLLRLAAGAVACLLFARASMTASKVIRYFDVRRATEGQLALERQVELAATFVRVGAAVQVLALVLSALGADRLSHGVRGAMCAYGVFGANAWGFPSLGITAVVALAAGVLTQVYAFDARVRTLDLARPLAGLTLVMAPLSIIDLAAASKFLLGLDLSVVASCCSVRLDAVAGAGEAFVTGPRLLVTGLAVAGTVGCIATALLGSRAPSRRRTVVAGLVALVTLPVALAATVLEVAPYVFEVPQHVCPFCLLRGDVLAIGYPLYGAIFLAAVWELGAAASAGLARGTEATGALGPFARRRLTRSALAWLVALAIGVAPVVRFALVSGGASLFAQP